MNNKQKLTNVLNDIFYSRDIDTRDYLYEIINIRPFLYIYKLDEKLYKEFLEYINNNTKYMERLSELGEAVEHKYLSADRVKTEKLRIDEYFRSLSKYNKEILALEEERKTTDKFLPENIRNYSDKLEKIKKEIEYYNRQIIRAKNDIIEYRKELPTLRKRLITKEDIDNFFALNDKLLTKKTK